MATTVTINNKKYDVPKLGFGHMEMLESEGYDVLAMFRKNQIFAPASAFIMLCAKCDREEANRLAEQHIYGGGNMNEIYQAFVNAINESDFSERFSVWTRTRRVRRNLRLRRRKYSS